MHNKTILNQRLALAKATSKWPSICFQVAHATSYINTKKWPSFQLANASRMRVERIRVKSLVLIPNKLSSVLNKLDTQVSSLLRGNPTRSQIKNHQYSFAVNTDKQATQQDNFLNKTLIRKILLSKKNLLVKKQTKQPLILKSKQDSYLNVALEESNLNKKSNYVLKKLSDKNNLATNRLTIKDKIPFESNPPRGLQTIGNALDIFPITDKDLLASPDKKFSTKTINLVSNSLDNYKVLSTIKPKTKFYLNKIYKQTPLYLVPEKNHFTKNNTIFKANQTLSGIKQLYTNQFTSYYLYSPLKKKPKLNFFNISISKTKDQNLSLNILSSSNTGLPFGQANKTNFITNSKEFIYMKRKKILDKFQNSYSKQTEISLITISLASANRIRQWAEKMLPNGKVVGEVLNAETVHYKTLKPIKGGLFCERIFGPLKDHECACGKKFNIKNYLTKKSSLTETVNLGLAPTSNLGTNGLETLKTDNFSNLNTQIKLQKRYFCRSCDVEFTYSIIRRTQLGYIQLATPTTHVWFVKGIPSYISILLDMKKKHLQNIIYNSETLMLEHALRGRYFLPTTPKSIFLSWQKIMQSQYPENYGTIISDNLAAGLPRSNHYVSKLRTLLVNKDVQVAVSEPLNSNTISLKKVKNKKLQKQTMLLTNQIIGKQRTQDSTGKLIKDKKVLIKINDYQQQKLFYLENKKSYTKLALLAPATSTRSRLGTEASGSLVIKSLAEKQKSLQEKFPTENKTLTTKTQDIGLTGLTERAYLQQDYPFGILPFGKRSLVEFFSVLNYENVARHSVLKGKSITRFPDYIGYHRVFEPKNIPTLMEADSRILANARKGKIIPKSYFINKKSLRLDKQLVKKFNGLAKQAPTGPKDLSGQRLRRLYVASSMRNLETYGPLTGSVGRRSYGQKNQKKGWFKLINLLSRFKQEIQYIADARMTSKIVIPSHLNIPFTLKKTHLFNKIYVSKLRNVEILVLLFLNRFNFRLNNNSISKLMPVLQTSLNRLFCLNHFGTKGKNEILKQVQFPKKRPIPLYLLFFLKKYNDLTTIRKTFLLDQDFQVFVDKGNKIINDTKNLYEKYTSLKENQTPTRFCETFLTYSLRKTWSLYIKNDQLNLISKKGPSLYTFVGFNVFKTQVIKQFFSKNSAKKQQQKTTEYTDKNLLYFGQYEKKNKAFAFLVHEIIKINNFSCSSKQTNKLALMISLNLQKPFFSFLTKNYKHLMNFFTILQKKGRPLGRGLGRGQHFSSPQGQNGFLVSMYDSLKLFKNTKQIKIICKLDTFKHFSNTLNTHNLKLIKSVKISKPLIVFYLFLKTNKKHLVTKLYNSLLCDFSSHMPNKFKSWFNNLPNNIFSALIKRKYMTLPIFLLQTFVYFTNNKFIPRRPLGRLCVLDTSVSWKQNVKFILIASAFVQEPVRPLFTSVLLNKPSKFFFFLKDWKKTNTVERFWIQTVLKNYNPIENKDTHANILPNNLESNFIAKKLFSQKLVKYSKKLVFFTNKNFISNNIYCFSHRELWKQEKDWQNFACYSYSQPQLKDLPIPRYKNRNYDLVFNVDPTLSYTNNPAFPTQDILYSPGINLNTAFSGAGLIRNLLNEFNYTELKKIDKQNRVILFEYNKHVQNLKKRMTATWTWPWQRPTKTILKSVTVGQRSLENSHLGVAQAGLPEASLPKKSKLAYYKACHIRDVLIRRTKLTRKILNKFSTTNSIRASESLQQNINGLNMILTLLPVLPPALRPVLKIGGQFTISDLNRLYQRIIYRNERLKKFLKDPALSSSFEMKYAQRLVQEAVDNLIQNGKSGVIAEKDARGRLLKSLSDILKGKQGRFRQYLLGKRVDYSGRSVIVVGPGLKIHQCGIPKEMALVLYSPFLIKRILNEKLADTYLSAKKLILTNPLLVSQLLREIMKSCPVLLNRAPTLHRLGFQAFQPKLVDGKAILLHPLVCPAFNADFDGDQMAVHVPITFEARAEAWKLMLTRNNLLSPATGEPIILPSQDMVLGCYYLTTNLANKWCKTKQGYGMFFNDINNVLIAYNQNLIHLHASIWVKINSQIETGTIVEQPIEIRLPLKKYKYNSFGFVSNVIKKDLIINKLVTKTYRALRDTSVHYVSGVTLHNDVQVDVLTVGQRSLEDLPEKNTKNIINQTKSSNSTYLEIYSKAHNYIHFNGTVYSQIIRTTPGKILFNTILKNAIRKRPTLLSKTLVSSSARYCARY